MEEAGGGRSSFGVDRQALPTTTVLQLAFQSIGIVYGDIGTSPLYVLPGVFPNGFAHEDDILGALSIIFYTITLLPVVKYVFIVLRATDNGDGGTFALYSLICRYAKVGLIPNNQAEDANVSNYNLPLLDEMKRGKLAETIKSSLEKSEFAKYFLLFITMLGTSMVMGDGVLTPCISVLSAVGGLKEATTSMTEDRIVWISVIILILLFVVQRFGTDRVGYAFAPILTLWFFCIGLIGIYNFVKHDPSVIKALNPKFIVDYFKRNKKEAWISLGGTVLSITGAEALFADVGHFSVKSIQISMCGLTYPSIVLAYFGQTAYLRKHSEDIADVFFKSIPGPVYWPMFVIAVLAAVIASQALISGTFAIIQQSLSLGCFPRVKVVHTSAKFPGQVYIPEINYVLMILCVVVTVCFKNTITLGNAYGLAVVFVMFLTSCFLMLIMLMIWKTNTFLVLLYVLTIGLVELIYLSSVLYKFDQGGYLPLVFAAVLMFIMYVWNAVYRKKYYHELENKISSETVEEILTDTKFCRIPGLAMFYSELPQSIPPIFKHYVENVPALHSVLVFVCIKSLPISKVAIEERFSFRQLQPKQLNVFHCVVRYGYTDERNDKDHPFEDVLIDNLKEHIAHESLISHKMLQSSEGVFDEAKQQENVEKEVQVVGKAFNVGVVHLVGETEVIAAQGASVYKRILIDYCYSFLKNNLRDADKVFEIPHKRLVKVGMTYEL